MSLRPKKITTSFHFQQIKSSSVQSFTTNNNYSRFLDQQSHRPNEHQRILDLAQAKSETNLQKQGKHQKLYEIELRGDNQDFISQEDIQKSNQFYDFLQKLSKKTRINLLKDVFTQFRRWFFIYGNVNFSNCIFKITYQNRQEVISIFANQAFYNSLKNDTSIQNSHKKAHILIYLSKRSKLKIKQQNQAKFVQQFLILFDKYLLKNQTSKSFKILQFQNYLQQNLEYVLKAAKRSKFIKRTRSDSVWPFARIQNRLVNSKISIQQSQTSNFDEVISKKAEEYFQNQKDAQQQLRIRSTKIESSKEFKVKKATSFSHVYDTGIQIQNKQGQLYSSSNRKSALHIIKQQKSKQFFRKLSPKNVKIQKKTSIQKIVQKKQIQSKLIKFAYFKPFQKKTRKETTKQDQNVVTSQFRPISQPNSFTHIPEFLRGKRSPKKQNCKTNVQSFKKKQILHFNQSQNFDIQSIQSISQTPFSKFIFLNKNSPRKKQQFSSPKNSSYSQSKKISCLKQDQNQNKKKTNLNMTCKTGFFYKLKQTSTTIDTFSRTTNNTKNNIKDQSFANSSKQCSKFKNMSSNSLRINQCNLQCDIHQEKKHENFGFGSSSLQIKKIYSTITKKQPSAIRNFYKLELQAVKQSKMSEDKTQRIAQISQQSNTMSYHSKLEQIQQHEIVQNELDNLFGSNQIHDDLQQRQVEGLQQQFEQLLR